MSKTFKCVEHEEEVLEVYSFTGEDGGRKFSLLLPHVSPNEGIAFDSTTAPALALTILEAAGWPEDDPRSATKQIMMWLGDVVRTVERITAEAEAQAKLEAEALKLYRAYMAIHEPMNAIGGWHMLAEHTQETWLAVARRAREMRAGK